MGDQGAGYPFDEIDPEFVQNGLQIGRSEKFVPMHVLLEELEDGDDERALREHDAD